MTNNNTQLPVEVLKKIDSDANDYLGLKEVEFSQRSFNAYAAGATEWAIWKAKHDDLQKQLQAQDANVEILLDRIRQLKDKAEKMAKEHSDLNLALAAMLNGYQNLSMYQKDWFTVPKDLIDYYTKMVLEYDMPEIEQKNESNTTAPVKGEKEVAMGKEISISYTKGEWYLQEYTDAYTNIIRCNKGKGFETIFIGYTGQSNSPETRANARLMAAAPDLLETLQKIVAITDRNHATWAKAKAAIEKALSRKEGKEGAL